MEEKNKGIMDRIKKVVGAAVMAATISGISTDAIANEVDLSEANRQFITEFYENKPQLQFADYRAAEPGIVAMNYKSLKDAAIRKNCFDASIEKKFYDILNQRKSISDFLSENENAKLLDADVSKEILKQYEKMSPEQIVETLKLKNSNLISENLVSLDTPNDTLRIKNLDNKIDDIDFSTMSVQDMAMLAAKIDIEIENNRKILQTKNTMLKDDPKYQKLKEAHEQIKSIIKSKKSSKFSSLNAEKISLMYEQSIIEAQIMLRDAEIEGEASQLVYGKDIEQEKNSLEMGNGAELSGQPNKTTADAVEMTVDHTMEDLKTSMKTGNSFRESIKVDKEDLQPVIQNKTENSLQMEKDDEFVK